MKTAVITGGTGGIGEACVKLFSKKGYRVFFIYRSREEKAKQLEKETGAVGVKADISDYDSTIEAIDNITKQCFEIDVLINNAGISQQRLFIDIMPEEWKKITDIDLNGVYNVTLPVVKKMIVKKRGAIVNISSIWGQCGASCEVAYSAAKSGVIGFTKALAKELGLSGIRVNCVAPGMIDTPMNGVFSEEDISQICSEIPLGRMGTAAECAELIYFLSSDDSSYITGQTIGINGGWEM